MTEQGDAREPVAPSPAAPPEQAERREQPEPFYKRHGLAFAISTLVLGVIVLFGAIGAGAVVIGSVASHAIPALRWMMPGDAGRDRAPAPDPSSGTGDRRVVLQGTIQRISGDTWTVAAQNGRDVAVRITGSTVFGHPGQESGAAADFSPGDEVVVVGTREDGAVTATRVLRLADFPVRPPSSPGPPRTPGSGL